MIIEVLPPLSRGERNSCSHNPLSDAFSTNPSLPKLPILLGLFIASSHATLTFMISLSAFGSIRKPEMQSPTRLATRLVLFTDKGAYRFPKIGISSSGVHFLEVMFCSRRDVQRKGKLGHYPDFFRLDAMQPIRGSLIGNL